MDYNEYIATREYASIDAGFEPNESSYPEAIFPHQAAVVTWACKRGRAGVFMDTGLGKTITQLTWGDQVQRHTDGYVLLLAPLAVAHQTEREASKFGLSARFVADESEVDAPGIYITNYEKLKHFSPDMWSGVILDESSILKGMDGRMRKMITDFFSATPYRLSCTATPSPNDFMELGTQSEFLGIMSQLEMLAMFFIHDTSGGTGDWRLKHHGKSKFWEWLSTWCVFMRTPADIGFDTDGYNLPPVEYNQYTIQTKPDNGQLFVEPAQSLSDRNKARRDTVESRCRKAADIVNALNEPAVVWCHLNDESAMLTDLIDGAVEVRGADKPEHKTSAMLNFADGKIKCLVTKPKIAGFGMNWQSSRHCVFVGLSDSWESYYQAIRRQWRFGQTKTVHCHVVSADIEGAVVENIRRKDAQHDELSAAMMTHMKDLMKKEIFGAKLEKTDYSANEEMILPVWI